MSASLYVTQPKPKPAAEESTAVVDVRSNPDENSDATLLDLFVARPHAPVAPLDVGDLPWYARCGLRIAADVPWDSNIAGSGTSSACQMALGWLSFLGHSTVWLTLFLVYYHIVNLSVASSTALTSFHVLFQASTTPMWIRSHRSIFVAAVLRRPKFQNQLRHSWRYIVRGFFCMAILNAIATWFIVLPVVFPVQMPSLVFGSSETNALLDLSLGWILLCLTPINTAWYSIGMVGLMVHDQGFVLVGESVDQYVDTIVMELSKPPSEVNAKRLAKVQRGMTMLMKGFNSSIGFRAAVHCLTSLHFAMAGVFIMVWPRGGTLTLSLQQVIIGGVYVFMCIAFLSRQGKVTLIAQKFNGVRERLNSIDVLPQAIAHFGSLHALESWLDKQRIGARLGGVVISHSLIMRVVSGAATIAGAASVYALRNVVSS